MNPETMSESNNFDAGNFPKHEIGCGVESGEEIQGEKERNDSNISRTSEIIETMNFLNDIKKHSNFSDLKKKIEDMVDNIKDTNDNFFIKSKIDQLTELPLDSYSIAEKRLMLKLNWRYLMSIENFCDTIIQVLAEKNKQNHNLAILK